jgi:ankyrin repeat protein
MSESGGTHAALFAAIDRGDRARVEELVLGDAACLNARNERGDSALLAAAYLGRRDILDLLLEQGAEVGLFEASALGLEAAAAALLESAPEAIHAYSHDGWTALHLAAFFGHRGVAALLLDRGADVNARSRNTRVARDNTPLHAAAANRRVDVAELLVARGADVNARDGSGFTPLALAANSRSDMMMLLLMENGARAH